MLDFDAIVKSFRQKLGFPKQDGTRGTYPAGFLVSRVANHLDSIIDQDPADIIKPLLKFFAKEFRDETQGLLTKSGEAGASLYKLGSGYALYRLFELRHDDLSSSAVSFIRAVGIVGSVGRIREGIPIGDLDPLRRLLQQVLVNTEYLPRLVDAASDCGSRVNRDSLERFRHELASWEEWSCTSTQQEQLSVLYSALNEANRFYGGEARSTVEIASGEKVYKSPGYLEGICDWDPDALELLGTKHQLDYENEEEMERWINDGLAPDELPRSRILVVDRRRPDLSRYFQEVLQAKSFYLRISRPFDVRDGRCLTVPESKDLIEQLLLIADDRDAVKEDRMAAVVVLLQIVTAWSYRTIQRSRWSIKGGRRASISATGEFVQAVPNYSRFSKWQGPIRTSGFVHLTLPRSVIQALNQISSFGNDQRIFPGSEKSLQKSVAALFIKLRRRNPRIIADRVAETVPTLIYESTQDLRQVQLICGSNFGLSAWPLFYYATKNSVLTKQYQKALSKLFEEGQWNESRADEDERWVGSRLGANLETAVEIVKHLEGEVKRHDCGGKGKGPRSLSSWLSYLNALARKTAFMAGMPVGYRNVDCVGEINVFDFALHNDAHSMLVGDKGADSAHMGYRISSLGTNGASDQVRVLLTKYQQFLDSRHKTPFAQAIKDEIRKALAGSAGVFLAFDPETGASPASQRWLKLGLPDPEIPVNLFRHIVASYWIDAGGASRDLFTQIGHSGYADHRFSEAAMDCPYSFMKRVEPVVDEIMRRLGWQVTVIDKNLKCPIDSHPSCDLSSRVRLATRRGKAGNQDTEQSLQQEFQQACREFTALKLEEIGAAENPDWSTLEVECLAEIAVLQKSFRVSVGSRSHSDTFKTILTELQEEQSDVILAPAVEDKYLLPEHMDAWGVVTRLREYKRRVDLGKEPRLSDSTSMALDLLLGRPFKDKQHFLSVLDATQEARLLSVPKNVLEVRMGADGQPAVEWLSPTLAIQLARNSQERHTAKDLTAELAKVMAAFGLNGIDFRFPISRIISLVSQCARIEYPGLCLSAQLTPEFQSPLSRERTEDWRNNQFGTGEGWPEGLEESDAPKVRTKKKLGAMPWEGVVNQISGLIAAATPETSESMSRFRAQVRKQKQKICFSSDMSAEARILVDYLSRISAGGAKKKGGGSLAISTIAKYQNVATSALRWMASNYVSSPQEAYELILGDGDEQSGRMLSSAYQRSKIEALRRLDALLVSDYGFEPADHHLWSQVDGYRSPAKAEIVTDREYQKSISILMDWSSQASTVPTRWYQAAITSLMLMFEAGLRPEESIGLTVDDLIYGDGQVQYLVIRTNALRRTKNRTRQRLVCLSELSADLRAVLRTIARRSKKIAMSTAQSNVPLLVSDVRYAQESKFIADVINESLRVATGSDCARRYSCRHSYVNHHIRRILEARSGVSFGSKSSGGAQPVSDIVDISIRAGHSRIRTTARHYTHVGHLGLGLFSPAVTSPNKTLKSVWQGRSLPKRLRQRLDAQEAVSA